MCRSFSPIALSLQLVPPLTEVESDDDDEDEDDDEELDDDNFLGSGSDDEKADDEKAPAQLKRSADGV